MKNIRKVIENEVKVVENFSFNAKEIAFYRKTDYGFNSIIFNDKNTFGKVFYITANIRFNKVQDIYSFYKVKFDLMNPEFSDEHVTISVDISKLIGQEYYFNLEEYSSLELNKYINTIVIPFFNNFNTIEKAEGVFYHSNLIQYIEPHNSFYKMIFAYLNNQPKTVFTEIKQEFEHAQGGMVHLYNDAFHALCRDIEKGSVGTL